MPYTQGFKRDFRRSAPTRDPSGTGPTGPTEPTETGPPPEGAPIQPEAMLTPEVTGPGPTEVTDPGSETPPPSDPTPTPTRPTEQTVAPLEGAPVTAGETYALPGERGFRPFQGSLFSRDLNSRSGGDRGRGGIVASDAMRRGDLARVLSPGTLGGGVSGRGIGGQTLGDILGEENKSDFLRQSGTY